MTKLRLINLALLVLLSVATGAVKLAAMPEEMKLFRTAGVPDVATHALGVIQAGAGLALLRRAWRIHAARVLAATYLFATGVLFVAGMYAFGVFSVLFIAMAAIEARAQRR